VRGLALAAAANSVFKGVWALSVGERSFGWRVLVGMLVSSAAGVAVAFLVPLPG